MKDYGGHTHLLNTSGNGCHKYCPACRAIAGDDAKVRARVTAFAGLSHTQIADAWKATYTETTRDLRIEEIESAISAIAADARALVARAEAVLAKLPKGAT